MAITTYAELQTAVMDYLDRPDLSSFVTTFITLAEGSINARLRVRQMETVANLTPTAGAVTLPTDYLQYRRVVDLGSPRNELDYVSPSVADNLYPYGTAGRALDFTIIGDSLKTYPLTSYDVELTYYAAVPALSVSNTTNWLLTKRPELYLRLSIAHAANFIQDNQAASLNLQLAEALMMSMEQENELANYARANTRLKSVSP